MKQSSLLVVDDNPGIRILLEDLFSSKGYKVGTAASEEITWFQSEYESDLDVCIR
ncbi:hypothetical protein [Desulfosporosinus sp. FKA]|uniref:hypothetical protein n=1 Tax=Desulfosporosinus sp. FKA TaxID=1969834 RepID=UPI001FA82ECB|nr:hypothetical protein [Desulfosporosinus sp. FKA]